MMFNPFQLMGQFQQFKSQFQGDPKETVQQMLNNGQITQEQLNQIMPMAQQMYQAMNGGKNGR